MVIEGLLITRSSNGQPHAAAMGPVVREERADWFELRPFRDTRTLANLQRCAEGVFHIVDDVLVLARVVTGQPLEEHELRTAQEVHGWIWQGACSAWEFRVAGESAGTELRAAIRCRILRRHHLKPFVGFNRARHALLELAITVTRLHLLPSDEIRTALAEAERLTQKTGGPRERAALQLLQRTIQARWHGAEQRA